jgi:hypothetical protein
MAGNPFLFNECDISKPKRRKEDVRGIN